MLTSDVNILEFRQIKDIKGGEYVLSLNEETQKIEPHKIKGLLDKGIQSVFKLTTESGRSIRTTGNHPYLTHQGWQEVTQLKIGDEIAVPNLPLFSFLDGPGFKNSINYDSHCYSQETTGYIKECHSNYYSNEAKNIWPTLANIPESDFIW